MTHEINPVLPYVDRVLYLADGRFRIGTRRRGDDLRERCPTLYGAPVEVIRVGGRIVVVGVAGPRGRLDSARRHSTTGSASTTFAPLERAGLWKRIFDFDRLRRAAARCVHNSLIAGAVLGVVGGLISVFVMMRDLPFAVHGISELSFAGAAGGAAARRQRGRRARSSARCSPRS